MLSARTRSRGRSAHALREKVVWEPSEPVRRTIAELACFEAPKLVGGVDGLDASVVSITKLPEGEGFEVVVEVASERRRLEINGDSFVQPRMRETIAAYVGDETVTAQTILVKAVAPDFANGRVNMVSKDRAVVEQDEPRGGNRR